MQPVSVARLTQVLGVPPLQVSRLTGGCIGEVYRVEALGYPPLVAKVDASASARLSLEGWMLIVLRERTPLPVPEVLHNADDLLLMTFLEGSSVFDPAAEAHAAELLAELHAIRGSSFGLEQDTLLGGLPQPNPPTPEWIPFFRDQRLLFAARAAHAEGQLPASLLRRIEALAGQLDRWLEEPDYPVLIHGDAWTTNILAARGRITGFIDPAIYYAHPEIELAFITLFGTFGKAFFERYHALNPIEPGFFELRRDLYNLYPLLTHVRLFGGGYVGAVERIVARMGC